MDNLIKASLALGIESKGSCMSLHVQPLLLSTTSCLLSAFPIVFGCEELGWGRMLKGDAGFDGTGWKESAESDGVRERQ